MNRKADSESRLCFLDASHVGSPAGDLGRLQLQSERDEPLGTLDGVLIDPSARRVCYLVVETPGWFRKRKYLIPTECPAKLEPERNTLRVDIEPDAVGSLEEFDRRDVREYSEQDTVEAMFARHVA